MSELIIQQNELNRLEEVRLELHEIAKHNSQIEQYMLTITSKLWPIIHRKRAKCKTYTEAEHTELMQALKDKHEAEIKLKNKSIKMVFDKHEQELEAQREACAMGFKKYAENRGDLSSDWIDMTVGMLRNISASIERSE